MPESLGCKTRKRKLISSPTNTQLLQREDGGNNQSLEILQVQKFLILTTRVQRIAVQPVMKSVTNFI